MSVIIDPTNENVAIVDGRLAGSVRAGKLDDPKAPTVTELDAMPIIGYGFIGWKADS